jgi:tetratricopeptide (TPR) repeat protein
MARNRIALLTCLLVSVLCCLAAVTAYNLPPLHQRLAGWQVRIQRALLPEERLVFLPQASSDPSALQTVVRATLDAMRPSDTPEPAAALPASAVPTHAAPGLATAPQTEATPAPTATASPTPIPPRALLQGIRYQAQEFNNCGPANLAMALSYWGWQGDQRDTRAYLRPNRQVDDKNVNPGEMAAYVTQFTPLRAVTGVGGDLDLLKRLIAAGFPVLIEEGHDPPDDYWMGHYLVLNGYDDEKGQLTAQDSLVGADLPLDYAGFASGTWRDFNYVYLVVYPPEREAEVLSILGPRIDPAYSFQLAAQRAVQEASALQGRQQFFAWFNLGASLVGLGDYPAAAQAYDQAFALARALPEEQRLYRLMWYQDGPYRAYYQAGRYQDVIDLANATIAWVGRAVLEESYYWRGRAYEALGEVKPAIGDYQKAAALNPNYAPPRDELRRLGVEIP